MRLFWWRRNADQDKEPKEAQQAVENALADWPRVDEVSTRARRLRERNGFGEAINKAMGGR